MGSPSLAFIWDHQVQGAAIVPGAAYCELATAAARTLLKLASSSVALVSASIAAPCMLPAAVEATGLVLSAEVALSAGEVSIRSGPAGAMSGKGAGTLHLRGSVTAARAAAVAAAGSVSAGQEELALSADAARAACREPHDTAGMYSKLVAAGLQYGPSFR